MAARRPLVEGLKTENAVDRSLEEDFVYNGGPKTEGATKPQPTAPASEPEAGKGRTENTAGRVPLTVRFRANVINRSPSYGILIVCIVDGYDPGMPQLWG
jgi:hypothetical protein